MMIKPPKIFREAFFSVPKCDGVLRGLLYVECAEFFMCFTSTIESCLFFQKLSLGR